MWVPLAREEQHPSQFHSQPAGHEFTHHFPLHLRPNLQRRLHPPDMGSVSPGKPGSIVSFCDDPCLTTVFDDQGRIGLPHPTPRL